MTKEIKKVMNLDNPIPEDSLNGYLFSNENKGHKFIISCTKGGELQTLTGSVTVRFMRANNTTILLGQGGSDGRENYAQIVDGNAEVTLHPDCYNVPGRFKISVFNISGDTVSCVYVGVGTVSRTQNGELIDSGEIVPSIDELVGYIDDCIAATENAEAAADHAVRYDVAQTLTDSQKAQARTNIDASSRSDVDDLKSAINYTDDILLGGKKILNNAYVDGGGVIQIGNYTTTCYRVKPSSIIATLTSDESLVYAFFVNEPNIGSVSYNNSREIPGTVSVSNITVPSGCNWVAVRNTVGLGNSITPNSYTISEMIARITANENDLDKTTIFKGQYNNSLNDLKESSIRYVTSSVSSSPFAGKASCIVQTIDFNNGLYFQIATGITGDFIGVQFARTYVAGDWTDWFSWDINLFTSKGEYTNTLDNVKDNTVRYIPATVQSSPFYNVSACALHTFALIDGAYMQVAYGLSGTAKGKRYTRAFVANDWNEWICYDVDTDEFLKYIKASGQYTGSIDNIKDNSIRYIDSSVTGSPFYGVSACAVYTFEIVPNAYMQIAYGFSAAYKGIRYTRTYILGAWTDWVTYDMGNRYVSNPKYYAFGDSLTWGAKWVSTQASPGYEIIQVAKEYQIPTRIAHAVGASGAFENDGVGGATLVGDGSGTILGKIKSTSMDDANLITVAGGRNDSSNTLGTAAGSTAGDGTICGAVRSIIEYLQANYKKAQIVWIGVTPNTAGSDNSKVFTWVTPGGWSLNTFDEQISLVCAEYCVPYVNWKQCSYMMHWADYSGAGGVYSHPDNEESYLQIGNYIAGKVAQYYRG